MKGHPAAQTELSFLVNLLYTTVPGYQTSRTQSNILEWRRQHHLVEYLPFQRVANYLRFETSSGLALIDAIVCSADAVGSSVGKDFKPIFNYPLDHGLVLSWRISDLPESCAMRDGRKWKAIPLIIFYSPVDHEMAEYARRETHAHLIPAGYARHPVIMAMVIKGIVDQFHQKVLNDYQYCGILVLFQNGRAQIKPALKRKRSLVESEFYYSSADRRQLQGWVTFSREKEGVRNDAALFEQLLNRRASETEMHQFFAQHPAILMEARRGVPLSHGLNFTEPKGWKPDFAISSILGPVDGEIELLELKGPSERTITGRFHPGFSRKVHAAVDQVRDYERYLRNPANFDALLKSFGSIPETSRLAVLIGRDPDTESEKETLRRRREEIDVKVITYDEILSTQVQQLNSRY